MCNAWFLFTSSWPKRLKGIWNVHTWYREYAKRTAFVAYARHTVSTTFTVVTGEVSRMNVQEYLISEAARLRKGRKNR